MHRRLVCTFAILTGCVDTDEVTSQNIAAAAGDVAPPGQPATGPGGAQLPYASFTWAGYGSGADAYWIFEPSPAPATAPVVVFVHGWEALDPIPYLTWIDHLVRRGNIVIYPRYQNAATISPFYTPAAVRAVQAAYDVLATDGHVHSDGRLAIVGHSAGGIVAANLAARAVGAGLPAPLALMSVEPGSLFAVPLDELSQLPPMLLLTIAGDADNLAGTLGAQWIYARASSISPDDKDYILVQSDGQLIANHFAPTAATTDGLDFYAYWKLFDGLTDAAFYGTNREYALGNTPEQRFMGVWSNGVPVRELYVSDDPWAPAP